MADKQLNSTLKSMDTEEWLDIHFTRPLGLLWAKFFNYFGIHPNVVTILSIILGVAAGVCFYFEDIHITLLGIFLLVWANLYDSCDGQLARMTGKKTRLGRILDGFAGDAWFFTIYFFICLRLTPTWGIWIWLLAAVSGLICHAKQCQLADYYRNIHLFFLKGVSGSELDNADKLTNEFQGLSWKRDFLWKLFLFFYRNYTRSQEKLTPNFQSLSKALKEKFGNEALPQTLCDDFRKGSLPLMKWTNILTFNTRAIFLYLVLLLGQPWLYFVFELTIMNLICFYMRQKHEQLCKQILSQLGIYSNP
jgi:CDP-alcohol phosphatidyltransferase family protein